MHLSRTFAITSVLFLAVLAVSPAKDALRPYRSLQREYRRLGTERARTARAAAEYAGKPVAIHQIWLRDLDDRVDRCTTCHLGAADAAMAEAPEPFRLHPRTAHTPGDFERFGCTSCHGGQGLATDAADAHGRDPGADTPMVPLAYAEAGCGRCHTGETVADAPLLSRGRAVMSRSGCYACHAVRGHESFRSDAPPLATLPVKTGGAWLRRWLADPRAVDPNATMPSFKLSPGDIDELSHYLFAQTVPPEIAERVAAAAAEPPGDKVNGKKVFAESRCITCHTVEGKGNGSAPELSKVASAASPGWLLAFLRDPAAFDPRTRMPRYGLSTAESRDLVAYLEDEMRDFDAPADLLTPLRVNQTLAERGGKLFRRYGCFACHEDPGAGGERFGPELDGIGDKRAAALDFGRRTDLPRTLPAWLAAKINAPRSFADGLRMPVFALNADDAAAVTTALLALGAEQVPEAFRHDPPRPASLLPGGRVGELVARYRCLSCHQIGNQGGDTSTAPLTFEGSKVKRDWLVDYLVVSYSLRPILEERMPLLRIPREDAAQIADAVESFYVDPAIPGDPFAGHPAADATAPNIAEGERLYTTLGCRGCHIRGESGGYYGPPLTGAAARLKPGWIFTWLKGPQRWRADVRCPDYGLTDTDALRLTAYLETAPTETTAVKTAKRGAP
jgi:mono/diheme cytochrome c family protein